MYPIVKLGEIYQNIQYGYTGKTNKSGKYKLLRITDIQENIIIWDNVPFVEISDEEARKYLLNAGDIVFARTGATVGKSCLIDERGVGQVFASYLIRVNESNGMVLGKYIQYFFYSRAYWSQIFADVVGAAQPNFNGTKLKNLQIPLPSLPTQIAIVAQLDAAFANIDTQISLLRANIADVENVRKSVLEESFQDREYEKKKLSEIIILNYGKAVDKLDKSDEGLYDVYGANGIMYKSRKFNFDGESIIIGRKGSAGAINKVSGKFWASDVTYYVTSHQNMDYICYVLKKLNLPLLAKGVKPGINRNDVYEIQIPLPPLSRQHEIVAHLDQVFAETAKLKTQYEAQIQDLNTLKQSLLEEAFSGRLVPEEK